MDLNPEGLNVVRAVRSTCEVGQVELDLVPTLVESHWHSTDERLHPSRGLVVRRSETTTDIFVVQHLDFEREVLLQLRMWRTVSRVPRRWKKEKEKWCYVFDDHDQERKLDSQRLFRIRRSGDEIGAHVRPHDFEDTGLDVLIGDSLDVAVADYTHTKGRGFRWYRRRRMNEGAKDEVL